MLRPEDDALGRVAGERVDKGPRRAAHVLATPIDIVQSYRVRHDEPSDSRELDVPCAAAERVGRPLRRGLRRAEVAPGEAQVRRAGEVQARRASKARPAASVGRLSLRDASDFSEF